MFEKLRFLKNLVMKNFFDFSRQCKYLKLEKPLGIEIEMHVHKRSTIDWLEGWADKVNNKYQNIANNIPNFISGFKIMLFFSEKLLFKGGGKTPLPGTQALKNSLGPIGLK